MDILAKCCTSVVPCLERSESIFAPVFGCVFQNLNQKVIFHALNSFIYKYNYTDWASN